MMVKKLAKYIPVFLMLVVIPSCTRPVMDLNYAPLPTMADGSPYTKTQVQAAIIEACRQRGWVAQPKVKGLIEASIIVRYNRAKVEIRYDEIQISILYKDSYHLDYSNGNIHRNYNRWIASLYRAIIRELHSHPD